MSTATLRYSVAWIRDHHREVRAGASWRHERVPPRPAGAGPSGSSLIGRTCTGGFAMGMLLTVTASDPAAAQAVPDPEAPEIVLPTLPVEAGPSARIGSERQNNEPCVVVDIAGHRAGYLDCASAALSEAARIARLEAQALRDISVVQAGSPDVQVGVASRSATRLRLRENFGVSVRPPAMPAPVYTSSKGRLP